MNEGVWLPNLHTACLTGRNEMNGRHLKDSRLCCVIFQLYVGGRSHNVI